MQKISKRASSDGRMIGEAFSNIFLYYLCLSIHYNMNSRDAMCTYLVVI